MCIKKVESFEFAGKLYLTELGAVTAALTEVSARLLKDHHSNLFHGLIDNGDKLVELLTRHAQLSAPEVTSVPWKEPLPGTSLKSYRAEVTAWVLEDDARHLEACAFLDTRGQEGPFAVWVQTADADDIQALAAHFNKAGFE